MQGQFRLAEPPEAELANMAAALFKHEAQFLKGVVDMAGLPPGDRVEVCFAGRSNVGKSSLINALTGRRALARTSNTPGRTQEINFFTLGPEVYLVDVPGYGFAKAPVAVVENWQAHLKNYLTGRASLRRAFMLIDARHGAKAVDEEIMSMLDRAAVPFQIVMTKCDKVKETDRARATKKTMDILAKHPAAYPLIIETSSVKSTGIGILRAEIASIT